MSDGCVITMMVAISILNNKKQLPLWVSLLLVYFSRKTDTTKTLESMGEEEKST